MVLLMDDPRVVGRRAVAPVGGVHGNEPHVREDGQDEPVRRRDGLLARELAEGLRRGDPRMRVGRLLRRRRYVAADAADRRAAAHVVGRAHLAVQRKLRAVRIVREAASVEPPPPVARVETEPDLRVVCQKRRRPGLVQGRGGRAGAGEKGLDRVEREDVRERRLPRFDMQGEDLAVGAVRFAPRVLERIPPRRVVRVVPQGAFGVEVEPAPVARGDGVVEVAVEEQMPADRVEILDVVRPDRKRAVRQPRPRLQIVRPRVWPGRRVDVGRLRIAVRDGRDMAPEQFAEFAARRQIVLVPRHAVRREQGVQRTEQGEPPLFLDDLLAPPGVIADGGPDVFYVEPPDFVQDPSLFGGGRERGGVPRVLQPVLGAHGEKGVHVRQRQNADRHERQKQIERDLSGPCPHVQRPWKFM